MSSPKQQSLINQRTSTEAFSASKSEYGQSSELDIVLLIQRMAQLKLDIKIGIAKIDMLEKQHRANPELEVAPLVEQFRLECTARSREIRALCLQYKRMPNVDGQPHM